MSDLSGSLDRLAFLPPSWRYRIVSAALGRQSRYFRTHGFRIVHIEAGKVSIAAGNRRGLRNRAGGIHSMAASLAGEYAAALVVAQHLACSAKLVVRRVQADFRKPLCGDIQAHASLDPAQVGAVSGACDGQLRVAMQVVDASGKVPIRGHVDVVWRSPMRAHDVS
ncbi:DUF4442 domain-containing protein [Lysobacter capsici]|uniref:DUF4442 domain-containing protein n=1 Tax=Lysobacter capsici TaxID=435897 RepID=UPI001C000E44|nr:DUF4442 domain-containing protein [Lysobacter capsici]QWF16550.1 DUF4442 domain-containing protein [Lysobacter capsici]